MGTFASGERKTIERLCCYIKDDSMIATYVGVPKSEVVRIRAKARRAPSERIGPSLDGPPKASERPDNSSVIQRTNAAQGSADLLKALERHYAQTDRKSTRLNSVTNAHLVCRLLLEKKNKKEPTPDRQNDTGTTQPKYTR